MLLATLYKGSILDDAISGGGSKLGSIGTICIKIMILISSEVKQISFERWKFYSCSVTL